MTGLDRDGSSFECHVYYAYGDIRQFEQKEDEILGIYPVESLDREKALENRRWLIPFGLSTDGATFMRMDYSQKELMTSGG